MGFDSEGNPIDYTKCSTAEEICENSTKLITVVNRNRECINDMIIPNVP